MDQQNKQFNFTTEQEDVLAQVASYEEQMQAEADVYLDDDLNALE